MGEEAVYNFGNSMLLTNLFGEDKVFAGCFSLHRGIATVAMQKKPRPRWWELQLPRTGTATERGQSQRSYKS